MLERNPIHRLGGRSGADEVKAHPYFEGVNWEDVKNRKLKPPAPYLAEYAKNIIDTHPYMAAKNPKT